jgi:hypothetical protein
MEMYGITIVLILHLPPLNVWIDEMQGVMVCTCFETVCVLVDLV